jgi:death on curing protein
MLFPRKDEVLKIHRQMIERFGGMPGLRDEGLLESALTAPANRCHYEDASLAVCAATYAFHLTDNHPCADGNKRVGAAVAEIFVQLHGGQLVATNDEIVELFFDIASGLLSERRGRGKDSSRWLVPPAQHGSPESK